MGSKIPVKKNFTAKFYKNDKIIDKPKKPKQTPNKSQALSFKEPLFQRGEVWRHRS